MNHHYYNSSGTSKPSTRPRGVGGPVHGLPMRLPANPTLATSAFIDTAVAGGCKDFPSEYSTGNPNIPNNIGNIYLTRSLPIMRNFAEPYLASNVTCSNEYSTSELTEFSAVFSADDKDSENIDVATVPSDLTDIMHHYALLGSLEELRSKVHKGNIISAEDIPETFNRYNIKNRDLGPSSQNEISQIKAAQLLRKIEKYSANNNGSVEPKFKEFGQQTDSVQQRNVSQQTFHCDNETVELYEMSGEDEVKRRKIADYRLLESNKRHVAVESMRLSVGKVDLKCVAGLSDAKIIIRETFLLPLTHPHLFNFFQGTVKRCCRCLLYGPPGTGKTLLAQAIASELGASLYYVSCAGILSCYIGESEKNVKELFEHALEQEKPSVIFFDEIDSVCRKRTEAESEHSRRLKTELLKYFENPAMDESQVYVLSATNCPWDLDVAFLRRFQRHIYIPLPDSEGRQQIISQQLGQMRVLLSEDDWSQILNCTEGFSGSDLTNLVSIAVAQPNREILRATHWRCFDGEHIIPCDSACDNAFHASLDEVPPEKVMARSVTLNDFLYAARETPRTVTDEHILQFDNFKRHFSQ